MHARGKPERRGKRKSKLIQGRLCSFRALLLFNEAVQNQCIMKRGNQLLLRAAVPRFIRCGKVQPKCCKILYCYFLKLLQIFIFI